jgi:hypothetical protein
MHRQLSSHQQIIIVGLADAKALRLFAEQVVPDVAEA